MEEELEVILRAVDEASDTFEAVAKTGEEMGSSLEQAFEEANAEVERLREELDFAEEWGFVNDVEELEAQLSEAESEAERLGAALEEATSKGSDGFGEVEDSAEGAADPISQIGNILEGFVGVEVFSQLADTLWDFADKAGSFEDSMMRARLEAEGAGISVNDMTDAVSELSATTGRAGGEIRESFIKATARGITDLDSFKSMMNGAGAQATLLGTDITTMADKFSGFASRSRIMEKALANTGITIEELGDALGIQGATIDDVNAKWETMTEDQRAAALGMAATMNEGQTANEEYKKSWAGLQAQVDIAKGRLERLAGEVLLPVLIPALETAARVLSWVGDVVQGVMDGPFGGLVSVIGTAAAAFALAVPAFMAVSAAYDFIAGSAMVAAAAELLALWPLALIAAAIGVVVYAVYELGKAFGWWTDVGSMMDAIWAGIQRLWSAFINHPDVQSFLAIMSQAWNILSAAVGKAISWVMSFFNNNSSGKFDIVRALIDGIGLAWEQITMPIRLVITVVKLLWTTVNTAGARIKATVDRIRTYFANLPGRIRGAIASLVNIITAPFTQGYNSIKGVVNSIISAANSITSGINLGGLVNKLTAPFSQAYNSIVGWAKKTYNDAQKWYNSITSGGARGGEDLGGAYGGVDLPFNNTTYTNGSLRVTNDVNLTLDLRNVPSNIDETTLKNALLEGLTDKEVLSALVNNNDFQSLDQRAKNRIMMRNNRARGV